MADGGGEHVGDLFDRQSGDVDVAVSVDREGDGANRSGDGLGRSPSAAGTATV